MMDSTPKHLFSPDRPIASRKEDQLGRSAFAESLASAIRGWQGNDTLVIALYGPWGSGKSSIKNMILESLRESPNDCLLLEKIVQVGFDIPQVERTRLEKVLFAGLNTLLGNNEEVGQRFDQHRWGNIFIPGLRPYFETLRDVYRFLNTLSFHVALLCNRGSFEVNPVDLIALGDISQAELDRILSLASDREGLVAEFRAFKEQNLLGVALNCLEAYKEKIDLLHAVPFITALFDIGDDLPDDPPGLFPIRADMQASRIIHWYLKQEKDPEKHGQILKEAMKATTGLYLPLMKTSLESREQEGQEDPEAFNVTEDELDEMQKICLEKILRAPESATLRSHPRDDFWRDDEDE